MRNWKGTLFMAAAATLTAADAFAWGGPHWHHHPVPGPVAAVGLPFLVAAGAVYGMVRRRRNRRSETSQDQTHRIGAEI